MMRARWRLLGLCCVLGCAIAPLLPAEQRVALEGSAAVSTEFSIGRLDALSAVAPQRFGTDARLTVATVEALDPDVFAAQSFVMNEFLGRVSAVARFDRSTLEALATLRVVHAPGSIDSPTAVAVVPGVAGLRIVHDPRGWSGPVMSVAFGRLRIVDPARVVVDELVDGGSLTLRWPGAFVGVESGITPLVPLFGYGIRRTEADRAAFTDPAGGVPPRRLVLARVETVLPVGRPLHANHALGLFGVYFDDQTSSPGDDAGYVGVVARGSVGPVAHESGVVGSVGSAGRVGLLGSIEATYRPTGSSAASVSLLVRYASGDAGLDAFVPITASPSGVLLAVPLSNAALARISASAPLGVTIGEKLVAKVSVTGFLVPVPRSGESRWLGFEAIGAIEYQILSDLFVDAQAGVTQWRPGWTPHARIAARVLL